VRELAAPARVGHRGRERRPKGRDGLLGRANDAAHDAEVAVALGRRGRELEAEGALRGHPHHPVAPGEQLAGLLVLLREDATLAMPPLAVWLLGPRAIGASLGAMVLTPEARGAFRFVATEANGLPALAAYRRGEDGAFAPFALHVVTVDGDRIAAMTAFLDPRVFGPFELPERA
jgi:hypothetical protein